MATSSNSGRKDAGVFLQRAMALSSQVTAERGVLQPSKRSQHPVINAACDIGTRLSSTPTRGAALLTASQRSSTRKNNSGFWEQGKSTKPSPVIDINDSDESLSLNYEPHSKTYGKSTRKAAPEGGVLTNFDKVALKAIQATSPAKNPIAKLSMNPSVTVTALSAPAPSGSPLSIQKNLKSSTSANCTPLLNKSFNCSSLSGNTSQSSSLPSSSRRLDFDSSNSNKKGNEENLEDSDSETFPIAPTKVKKFSRTPFKAVRKSSLLNGISPGKIERAYGGPSSNPEKENVPIVKEEEETLLQPHLLGFPNLGNTCYLNAVLQSLVSMRVFRLDVRSFVQRLPPPADSLLHGLASLLDARKTGRASILRRPLRLVKENFEKLDSSFIGWKMQDANEFLTKVLDTIKDEVDKLLAEEIHKSKMQKPTLPFSPIQSNAPRLFNNSVVIRSLSPGEAAAAYKSIDSRRGLKRSLSSENLGQIDSTTAGNGSDSSNSDSLRLAISDSEDNHSDGDCSPPRAKFSKTPSKNNGKMATKMKSSGGSGSFSNVTRSGPETRKECYEGIQNSAQQQLSFVKKSPQPSHRMCSDEKMPNCSLECDVSTNPITANFGFHLQEVYTCLGCSACVRRSQEYFSLYVHLASCEAPDSIRPGSIRAAVAEYMQQEQRDLKCERCSHPTALVTTTFTKMPRILIIQMKRYTFNAAEFSSLKVCSSIEVNKTLDLSSYTGSSVRCYPSLATSMVSAPSTPVKAPPPPALRVFGGARAEVLHSSSGEPSTAEVFGSNSADVTDSATAATTDLDSPKTKPLSEDEQLQEALRRSLEDTAVVPSKGSDDSAHVVPVISVDDEEDDLMKAIRLSLQEAQERERIKAAEEEALAQASAAKAVEAKEKEWLGVPDEDDECEGAHSYRLASIVSHYGKNTTAGHYVCDALSEKSDTWLHYDDECVTEVPISEVLGPSRQRNGYIFFYVHKDLLSSSSQVLSS